MANESAWLVLRSENKREERYIDLGAVTRAAFWTREAEPSGGEGGGGVTELAMARLVMPTEVVELYGGEAVAAYELWRGRFKAPAAPFPGSAR